MQPNVCRCCGQAMTLADLSNPNICSFCDPAVSESVACDEGVQHLRRFPADDCLTWGHAAPGEVEAA